MKNFYLIMIFVFLNAINALAQVDNPAYELMLKGLLSNSVKEISVNDAKTITDSVILLDTRSRQEYEISHIKNAIWIGYEDFELEKISSLSKDKKFILYCSVGYRSEKVGEKLQEAGYAHVYNLYGGLFEWINQGMTVYNQKGPTNEVHPYDKFWSIWLDEGKKVYE